ncbi:PCDHD1 [Mytilus edulis]|uniref:PCDHD1 n=1 Tax=Mytilus edulis TaxID=6550 RepID=A0A8S3R813_MYTED|nr:PCDHD1 [Mytilus edulis]
MTTHTELRLNWENTRKHLQPSVFLLQIDQYNVKTDANLSIPTNDASDVTFSFIKTDNKYEDLFHINERQSSLYTAQKLDRETICPYQAVCILGLEVIAKGTKVSFYQKIKVSVHLIDVNDHSPTFSVSSISSDISEGALVGTSIHISDQGAEDQDYGILGVQTYRIEDPTGTSPFKVNFTKNVDGTTNVKLILIKSLNREDKSFYNLRIIAEDGGTPKKFGSIQVTITVTDINDNSPTFSQTIPRQEKKNLELFDIDQNTGNLKVVASLIYESKEYYTIVVEAVDRGQQARKTQVNVYLHVNDVHNNPPQININLLSNADFAEISEDANLDTAVAHITVFDPDNGLNGIVECSSSSDVFKLQRFDVHEYKVVIKSPLNRETKPEHQVLVSCHDKGVQAMTSTAEFIVKVLDENDNKPKFTKDTYTVSIQENNKRGTALLKVSANDFDSGKNAELTYSMSSVARYEFHIDSLTGQISVLSILDRESTEKLTFTVFATDAGSPNLTGSAEVVVTVSDDNDKVPQFVEAHPVFSVPENYAAYTSIGIIQATDGDEGENKRLTFKLVPTHSVPFIVQPNVNVLDTNDNKPLFKFPNGNNNTVSISYQTQQHTVIATVATTDADDDTNARVTYFFKEKTYSGMFQINSLSGRITIVRQLSVHEAGRYTITITAQDAGTPPMIAEQVINFVITTQELGGLTANDDTEDGRQYFLIVIAISCVTVVIAVVIILTICLIKRADRLRQKYLDSHKDDTDGDKDTQKKVSFSNTMNNFDQIPNGSVDSDDNGRLYPELTRNTLPIESSLSLYPAIDLHGKQLVDRNKNQLSSLQLQQQLLETQHKNRKPINILSKANLKKVDGDDNSDLSAEVTTSDSGRGTSEHEDLNTSTVLSYSTDFEQLKQNQHRNFSPFYQSSPRGREQAICTTTNCSNFYQQPNFKI